jgi:hypothetical protein
VVNAFRAIDGFIEFSLKENGEIVTSNIGFDVESLFHPNQEIRLTLHRDATSARTPAGWGLFHRAYDDIDRDESI